MIKIVQTPASGAFGYVNYGFEAAATYGTVAASFPRPFGQGTKISISRKNNMERIHGLGARNASANVAKKFEGTATIEFLLGAGDTTLAHGGASWLRAVLGAIPNDAVAGSAWTHTYAESNTLASFSVANALELGTDYVSALIGCKVQSCTITAAVDEVAKVRLECPYRTETVASAGIGNAVTPTEVPLTFAQGTLTGKAGVTIGYVQNVELTITNNVEMVWGLGSRYSTAGPEKTRTYDVRMTVDFSDVTLLLENWAGTTVPYTASALATLNPAGIALVLTFTNGGAGAALRGVSFTFANFYLNEHTLPLDVNEVVKEDVTGWALSCTNIIVTNAQATDVAYP